ncbi:MAG: hypothetical protein IJN04_06090 [Clostridia bacterium]|nr:hypothetical protein [Clostridia bacterium]
MKKSSLDISDSASFGVWFYILAFFFFFGVSFSLSPMADDWYYITAPNPDFCLSDLLPTNTFWRPFDALYGALMGKMPALFPYLNRGVVIAGHILNGILLDSILRRSAVRLSWRRFAVCFFLFSSAAWAVTLSPDALNQAFSVLFGLVAIRLHLSKGGLYYLIPCGLALLWKESGISWFFVIPLLDACRIGKTWSGFCQNRSLLKRCLTQVVASLLVIAGYFIARFALYGGVALGTDEGTYKIALFSMATIKNAVLLFASACTGIDSVGLFGRERTLLWVAVTVLLSLGFVIAWAINLIRLMAKKQAVFPIVCLTLCALGLAFPLMIMGSAGEMHAYPVLCAMAVLYAYVFHRSGLTFRQVAVPIVMLFAAFTIASVHKVVSIYDYSHRTKALTASIRSQYDSPSEPTLFVVIDNWEGYSVFDQPAIKGTSNGLSVRPDHQWVEMTHFLYEATDEAEAQAYIQEHQDRYTAIFVVRDETAQRVK